MLRSDTPAPPHRFLSKTPWKIKRMESLGTWAAARRHTQGGPGLQPFSRIRGQVGDLSAPIWVCRFRCSTKTVLTETRKQFSIQRRMDMILSCLRAPSRGTQNWLGRSARPALITENSPRASRTLGVSRGLFPRPLQGARSGRIAIIKNLAKRSLWSIHQRGWPMHSAGSGFWG